MERLSSVVTGIPELAGDRPPGRSLVRWGSFQASISKADARDLDSGNPTPEAPRTILDFLATIQRLPLHLQAKGEFEFVGRKPLRNGMLSPELEC